MPCCSSVVRSAATRFATALPLFCVCLLCACSSIPAGLSAINSVSIEGAREVNEGDVEDKIATAASPKFLGLFRGTVYDYEIFDRLKLQRDLARVERYYRARGYYGAHARAGRVIK